MTFNDQPDLTGQNLTLHGLEASDFEGLYQAANDPETWAGHPVKNRHQYGIFRVYFDFLLEAGGTLLIKDQATNAPIGCSRYYTGPDAPSDIAIGFTFLNSAYWGGRTNFELKTLMLDHAFIDFEHVWFHIDPTNIRSQMATAKLGAVHVVDTQMDLGSGDASWSVFRLDKTAWHRVKMAH